MKNLMLTGVAGLMMLAAGTAIAPAQAYAKVHAAEGGGDPTFESLTTKGGGALVTVKMVMKMPGRDESREVEVAGTMIDPSGLVLVSNAQIGGMAARMGMPMPTPSDVKVLIGEDTEGLSAKVWTRDTDLDLAWVKIDEDKAKGKKFEFIDLTSASAPKPGDKLFGIQKMGKYFDRAVQVSMGYVAATTKKPRSLIVPGGSLQSTYGLPIFTADQKLAGFMVVQVPESDESENLRNGGFEGPMILPTAEVASATARAKEAPTPVEPPAEPAEAPAPPAAEGEKPAAEKPMDAPKP